MTLHSFTYAVDKKPVYIVHELIFGFRSDAQGTAIVSSGGAALVVTESIDYVRNQWQQVQGENNESKSKCACKGKPSLPEKRETVSQS